MAEPIILDLCGGTGAWSKPYADAGYDVRLVTLPELNVRAYRPPADVRGVLAAPPCRVLSNAGARYPRLHRELLEALEVIGHCLRIVAQSHPLWWALENPPGKTRTFLGDPTYSFQPWQFGDPWTKRTFLWGRFRPPRKRPVAPMHAITTNSVSIAKGIQRPTLRGTWRGEKAAALTAITPPGFARAFFEANP